MTSFKYTKGDYTIQIFANTEAEAQAAWDMLQERNYYPTIGRWYTETNSIEPPARDTCLPLGISSYLYTGNKTNNNMNTPHLVKQVCKFKHTICLYHTAWCDQWTISITPLMTKEGTARRIVTPKMAAHIIANVHTFA